MLKFEEMERHRLGLIISGLEEELRQVANIANHGSLMGIDTDHEALNKIRTATFIHWDADEAERLHLQRERRGT